MLLQFDFLKKAILLHGSYSILLQFDFLRKAIPFQDLDLCRIRRFILYLSAGERSYLNLFIFDVSYLNRAVPCDRSSFDRSTVSGSYFDASIIIEPSFMVTPTASSFSDDS